MVAETTSPAWHLAQVNVGRTVAPLNDPRLAEFMARLDEINAIAEASPGFVWRLQSDSGNATDIQLTDDPQFIVNLSVWETQQALFDFVYRSDHTAVMAKRRQWFEKSEKPFLALWWVPAGHLPSPREALDRLEILQKEGPTPRAFTFRKHFPAPDTVLVE